MTEDEPAFLSAIAACPPVPEAEIRAAERAVRDLSRRRFLKVLGAGAVVMAVGSKLDSVGTAILWPPAPGQIRLLPGAERLPRGGNEWLAWGGLGRMDSGNAAPGLYSRVVNGREVVADVVYPAGQSWGVRDLALVLHRHIRERRMKTISFYGASMGTVLALQSYAYLRDNPHEFGPLPRLANVAANSSPSCVDDAREGSLGNLLAVIESRGGFKPGVTAAVLYNSLATPEDRRAFIDIAHPGAWMAHEWEAIQKLSTDCSPENFLSQLRCLIEFDLNAQLGQYRPLLAGTNVVYMGSTTDNVVNPFAAARSYRHAAVVCGSARFDDFSTGASGHNDTWAAMRLLRPWWLTVAEIGLPRSPATSGLGK